MLNGVFSNLFESQLQLFKECFWREVHVASIHIEPIFEILGSRTCNVAYFPALPL